MGSGGVWLEQTALGGARFCFDFEALLHSPLQGGFCTAALFWVGIKTGNSAPWGGSLDTFHMLVFLSNPPHFPQVGVGGGHFDWHITSLLPGSGWCCGGSSENSTGIMPQCLGYSYTSLFCCYFSLSRLTRVLGVRNSRRNWHFWYFWTHFCPSLALQTMYIMPTNTLWTQPPLGVPPLPVVTLSS